MQFVTTFNNYTKWQWCKPDLDKWQELFSYSSSIFVLYILLFQLCCRLNFMLWVVTLLFNNGANAIRSNLSICQKILKNVLQQASKKTSIKYVRGPPDIICLSRRLLEGGRRGHPNTSERKAEWYLMSSAAPMHAYQRVAFTFLFSSSCDDTTEDI